jgi:hypothetical protein
VVNSAPLGLSLLILSEDTGKVAYPALMALAKKILWKIDPNVRSHRVELLPADRESQRALGGKAHSGGTAGAYRFRMLLAGKIADQLAKDGPNGFVVYHADADAKWSDRNSSSDFPDFALLSAAVQNRLGVPRRGGQPIESARLERLFLWAAYWEIEAWLYQNITEAKTKCKSTGCGLHDEMFSEWLANRAQLDDIANPKDACCLESQHNQELAEKAFPVGEAYDAQTSFAASVDKMAACKELLEALQLTYE